MSNGRKLMSRGGGIGESKMTTTADPEEFEKFDDGLPSREEWTWDGKYADQVANSHALPWQTTDQYLAMMAEKQMARIMERGGRLTVGADPADKNDQARKAAIDAHGNRAAAKKLDYKTVLKDEKGKGAAFVHMYVPEEEADTYRTDGFTPVIHNGNPVKYKDQVLTARPRAEQEAEDRQDVMQARRNMAAMQDDNEQTMKKRARDAKVSIASIPAEDFGLQDDYGV